MANGRQFSNDKLTCASWDYPLGTKVKVTSADNKAGVVLLVSDRPAKRFKGKRIDLSRGAMLALGGQQALDKGLIKVNVEEI